MDFITTFFIGYLSVFGKSEIVCVSENLNRVKYYMRFIRKITNYPISIQTINLPTSTAYGMYEDYILEEFTDEYLYLTKFDIEYLQKEIDQKIDNWENVVEELKALLSDIQSCGIRSAFNLLISGLIHIIDLLQSYLHSDSLLILMEDMILEKSIITSSDIRGYLEIRSQYFRERNEYLMNRSLRDQEYT